MRDPAWFMLSGVAHGALALGLATVRQPRPVQPAPPANDPIEIGFAVVDTPVEPEPQPQPPPTVAALAPAMRRPSRSTVSMPANMPAVEVPSERPAASAPAPNLLLSPRAAALAAIELESPGEADAGAVRKGPLRSEAQRSLEEALTSAVRHVDTRAEPVLRPKPGGGFLYTGNGFEATIDSDGSVQMEDRFVHAKWIFRPTTGADGELAGFRIFELKYDIFAWLDRKMGNDPFRSERRWFLDHTRAQRDEMMQHFHDKRVHSHEGE